jgi:PilZ domain
MQHFEKRILPRILLGEVRRGALTLMLGGQRIVIERLRDISNSGISFSLKQHVNVSERIAISYNDPSVKLEVFGRVAWCSQTRSPQDQHPWSGEYLMGVELLSPMMLYAVLPKA